MSNELITYSPGSNVPATYVDSEGFGPYFLKKGSDVPEALKPAMTFRDHMAVAESIMFASCWDDLSATQFGSVDEMVKALTQISKNIHYSKMVRDAAKVLIAQVLHTASLE